MINKYILPLLAVAGITLAIYTVVQARVTPKAPEPLINPPTRPPQMKTIAGAGLVEARMENIPIGVNIAGVVTKRFVNKGDKVKAGDPLFQIDDRDARAQLGIREAELASAQAQLHKLEMAPRPEDVPPAEAAVAETRARLEDAEVKLRRSEKLFERQMIAPSDYDIDRYNFLAAKATLARNEANLKLIKAGTWKEDLDIARAAVQQAESQLAQVQTTLNLLTVRAPTDGEVLQINVRLGQFAALAWREPMIVLGDVQHLHVRIDIDENDLPYFAPGSEAIATLKGRPQIRFPLKYKYVEPYVIPKQSLTGYNSERVDTRVLQVVYELPDDRPMNVFVGQQMDVYIRAAECPPGVLPDTDYNPKRLPFDTDPAPSTTSKGLRPQ